MRLWKQQPWQSVQLTLHWQIIVNPPLSGFLTNGHFLLPGAISGHTKLLSCPWSPARAGLLSRSSNVSQDSWGFCNTGLNAAGTDHKWKPLNGFNYHQLASAQPLVPGHATIWVAHSNNSVVSWKAPRIVPFRRFFQLVTRLAGLGQVTSHGNSVFTHSPPSAWLHLFYKDAFVMLL